MHRHAFNLLRLLCLALAVTAVVQVVSLAGAEDPLPETDAVDLAAVATPRPADTGETESPDPSGTGKPEKASPPKGKKAPPAVKLPVEYEAIHARGIFGVKPPRPPIPILLEGIGSDFAFIRSSKGRSGLVKAGETFDGIKVLTIGQNRVLIEVEGKKRELTIYQGLGGDSLMPTPAKEPEKNRLSFFHRREFFGSQRVASSTSRYIALYITLAAHPL